jgi:predicted nucleotidyltransferase
MVQPGELARVLVARHRETLERERERAEALRAAVRREVGKALMDGVASRAWLIGSLAWGPFGPGSDVDIVVCGAAHRDASVLAARLMELFGTDVDLLRLEDLPDAFRRRVEEEGSPIRAA